MTEDLKAWNKRGEEKDAKITTLEEQSANQKKTLQDNKASIEALNKSVKETKSEVEAKTKTNAASRAGKAEHSHMSPYNVYHNKGIFLLVGWVSQVCFFCSLHSKISPLIPGLRTPICW